MDASSAPIDLLSHATFATLCFTKQKNGTENEIVGHARSTLSTVCPVLVLIHRVQHLRQFNAPPSAFLCTVYSTPLCFSHITPAHLTAHLCLSAAAVFTTTGFHPTDVSARALRTGGAMALLCACVDPDLIKLIGRWKSNEMLRYLHLQAFPQMQSFARLMVTGGNFHSLHAPAPNGP